MLFGNAERMQHTETDKYEVDRGKTRESAHSKNLERQPRVSRQASRTDRGVGHHISAVCKRVEGTCGEAYMPARLCFGQLSITGKVSRVCANTTHAQAGVHLLTDVFSPYPDINSILTLIHIFSRVLARNEQEERYYHQNLYHGN